MADGYDSDASCGSSSSVHNNNITLEEFKKAVQMWVNEDDAIKKLREEIKTRSKKQKLLSEKMMKYMKSINKLRCEIGEAGSIEIKTRKSTSGLTEKKMKVALTEYFQNESEGDKLASYLKGKKETKENEIIKRFV